ncbi:MAG TPA: hypothetical protein VFO01_09285 [Trebonia sp.]|nr:hypothetical protein [Trebonia sp.]
MFQVGAEWLEIVRLRGGQAARRFLEAEQVHVQVPGRRGQVAHPLELGGVEREFTGSQAGQHVAEQLQRAPGPPHADPQVVQELGVDVAQHALGIGVDRVEQAQQDGCGRPGGGHVGSDVRVDLVRVVARTTTDSPQRIGERRLGASGDAGDGGQQAGRAAGLALVAAHLGDRQPRRQRA